MDIILKDSDFEAMPTDLRRPLLKFLSERMIADENIEIQREASEATKAGSVLLRPNVIPIEAACAVVFGLNENSILVLNAVLNADHNEGLSRADLGKILGSERAINGTIGSINRRFIHRFDPNIYELDPALKEMPLIDFYNSSYHIQSGYHEYGHLAFRVALHLKEIGLSLENNDIIITTPDNKSVRLSSVAYAQFKQGLGCINLYQQRSPGFPVVLDGHDANTIHHILQSEGEPVVMCVSQPSTSIIFSDGVNIIYRIGMRLFEKGTNYAKCEFQTEYSTQCLDPAKFKFETDMRKHPVPLSDGGQA